MSLEDVVDDTEAVAVSVALIEGVLVCVPLPVEDRVVEDDKDGLPVIVIIPVGVTDVVVVRVFVLDGDSVPLTLEDFVVVVVCEVETDPEDDLLCEELSLDTSELVVVAVFVAVVEEVRDDLEE